MLHNHLLLSQMLHDHLKIKFSVLRAYFEKLDRDAGNLVAVLHAKYHCSFTFHLSHSCFVLLSSAASQPKHNMILNDCVGSVINRICIQFEMSLSEK